MKIVNRKQYNDALDIIEAYHNQLNQLMDKSANYVGTPVKQWVSLNKPSARLTHILINYPYSEGGMPFKYIEDASWNEFRRFRNAGKTSWDELVEIRGY